jgi:signal transduction histidine kinase/DNA-binding response OmpR family regulator
MVNEDYAVNKDQILIPKSPRLVRVFIAQRKILFLTASIFCGSIALIFLGKSFQLNNQDYWEYQHTLEEKHHALDKLRQEVVTLKYNRDRASDESGNNFDAELKNLSTLQEELNSLPNFIDLKQESILTTKLQQEVKNLQLQQQALIAWQQHQEIVDKAYNDLLALKAELNKQELNYLSDRQVITRLNELLEEIKLYNITLNQSSASIIKTQIDMLKQLKIENNKEANFIFDRLISSGEILLYNQPKIEGLFQKTLISLDVENLAEVEQIIQSQYQTTSSKINRDRGLAYLFFLLTLCLSAYQIISNLKRTNRSIIHVLENFTAELETKVAQRTAELAESIDKTESALIQAKEANQAKSRFLANMSHELRTPLNAILGFTQLMCRDVSLAKEQQENIKIINRSGEHLLKLINDILEMSKIEVGQVTVNNNYFDLAIFLKSLEEMLSLKAKANNLELIFEKASGLHQYIEADEGKLRQILINLLGNALKFTQCGSVILRINSHSAEADKLDFLDSDSYYLHFEVEDTGPGISDREIDKLFTPFEQTEVGRQAQEGTGLGLSISQKFVELMGGELTVKSILGQGTIFKFDVLVKSIEPTNNELNRYLPVKSIAGGHSYRILVVDDVAESRLLLNKMLSNVGFEVQEAGNGKEAISVWQSWQPHLILMDMQMPILNGYEATKQIKALSTPDTQAVIIALTASAFEEERIVILAAGCDDFMRKPFYESELLEKIAQYLSVDYIYEEIDVNNLNSNPKDNNGASITQELTGEELEVMSPEWRRELYQAAERVDNRAIFQLIEQIPSQYSATAQKLALLVEHFRCDKIIDLTETALK